jgi:hypothetical protein
MVLRKKFFMLVAGLTAVFTIAACSEKLEGGASCPLLCPQQAADLRDTIIDAVVSDTTVIGVPPIGAEKYLMLASHGDTLETRVIVRYDTLPQHYTAAGNLDSTITRLDSAVLIIPILKPDTLHRPKGPITIEAYNVDSTPPDSISLPTDTVSAVLAKLFRPNRLLGSKTFAPESILDTLRLPISTDSVLNRVLNAKRLRVGFRLVSSQGYDLQFGSTQSGQPVTLRMKASMDTAAKAVTVSPLSQTPANQTFLAGPLADYSIVVRGGFATGVNLIGVGGVPTRRTLLRFNVPSRIVDSTTIVRASLLLTQSPNRRLAARDSVYVFPSAVLVQSSITDVRTLLQFVSASGIYGDSIPMAPADSGVRSFEVVRLVRTWHGTSGEVSPRSIVLRSSGEGGKPGEIDFFSSKAGAAVRPRLRITYVPQTSFGLP